MIITGFENNFFYTELLKFKPFSAENANRFSMFPLCEASRVENWTPELAQLRILNRNRHGLRVFCLRLKAHGVFKVRFAVPFLAVNFSLLRFGVTSKLQTVQK